LQWKKLFLIAKQPSALTEVLDSLLALEKKTRLAADLPSSRTVVTAILDLLFSLQKWNMLTDNFRFLCNRRAQMKPIVQTVVQKGVKYVDEIKSKPEKIQLINALRDVRNNC
jgi:26S proteasome regulatory subunit N5